MWAFRCVRHRWPSRAVDRWSSARDMKQFRSKDLHQTIDRELSSHGTDRLLGSNPSRAVLLVPGSPKFGAVALEAARFRPASLWRSPLYLGPFESTSPRLVKLRKNCP